MDFTGLSDNQLLQLIRASMDEAVKRGSAIAYAAQDVYIDAQEELRIKAEVAARAAQQEAELKRKRIEKEAEAAIQSSDAQKAREKQAEIWAKKASMIKALQEDPLFKDDEDFQLNIWNGGDIRIYLQELGKGRGGWEIVYYHTGNKYHPPGSIEGVGSADQSRLKLYFEEVCKKWQPGLKVSTTDVRNVEPHTKHLADYRQSLGATSNV